MQADVAAMKGIKPSTVVSHLADCIRAGFPVDVERLDVADDVEKLIVDVIRKPPINSGNFFSWILRLQGCIFQWLIDHSMFTFL